MRVIAVYIDNFNPSIYEPIIPCLSRKRINKLIQYRFIEDQVRSFVSELLIRVYAFKEWNIKNCDVDFTYNDFGKPEFRNDKEYHFNLSHAGQWAVAVLDDSEVGIDVEQIKPIDIAVAKRIFTEAETQQIMNQHGDNKLRKFYEIWMLKESYIKAVGKGLSIPLQSISFDLAQDKILYQTRLQESDGWHFKKYGIHSDYELAVCSKNSKYPEHVEMVPSSMLIEIFENIMQE